MESFLRYCLLLLMILFFNPCFSASDTLYYRKEFSGIKIAYNSSLVYPGVRFGIESPIRKICLSRTLKSGETRSMIRRQFLTTYLSWYHHSDFHDNFYLTIGWTSRRTGNKGWFWDFSPEAGVSRTFLGGTTYRINQNGTLSIERLAGYYYALISVGGGIGYDFSVVKMKPLDIFYKFNLLSMFPYNSTVYIRPAMELGVSYKITGLLPLRTKIRYIEK